MKYDVDDDETQPAPNCRSLTDHLAMHVLRSLGVAFVRTRTSPKLLDNRPCWGQHHTGTISDSTKLHGVMPPKETHISSGWFPDYVFLSRVIKLNNWISLFSLPLDKDPRAGDRMVTSTDDTCCGRRLVGPVVAGLFFLTICHWWKWLLLKEKHHQRLWGICERLASWSSYCLDVTAPSVARSAIPTGSMRLWGVAGLTSAKWLLSGESTFSVLQVLHWAEWQ